MVLGNTLDVILNLKVVDQQLKKLRAARARLSRFSAGARESNNRVAQSFNRVNRRADRSAGRIAGLTQKYSTFRMTMMSVFFGGLMLVMIFGRMLALMPGMSAATSALGAAFKMIMMPMSKILVPALIQLANILMNLPKPVKILISAFVVFATALGIIITLVGAFGMIIPGIAGVLGVFWTQVIAIASAMFGVFVVAFSAAYIAVKKFGKIVGIILIAIGVLVAFIANSPLIIAAAIGVILGAFWAMKDDIIKVVTDIANGIGNWFGKAGKWASKKTSQLVTGVTKKFSQMYRAGKRALVKTGKVMGKSAVKAAQMVKKGLVAIPKFFYNLGKKVGKKAANLGEKIIDGIVNGIKNAGDAIMDALNNLLPGGISIGDISDAIQGGIQTAKKATDTAVTGTQNALNVNDFVMTPSGQVLRYSPSDYIFGTKNPENLSGGGGGSNVEIVFEEPKIDSEVDMSKLMDEVESRLESNMRTDNTVF